MGQSLVVGCRIAPATRRLLESIAAREGRTLSKTIAALLEEAARGRVGEFGADGRPEARRARRPATTHSGG